MQAASFTVVQNASGLTYQIDHLLLRHADSDALKIR
jgi:hypothetical protein